MKNILLKVVLLLAVVVTVGLMGCEEARKTTGGDYDVDPFQSSLQGKWNYTGGGAESGTLEFDGNKFELLYKHDGDHSQSDPSTFRAAQKGTFKVNGTFMILSQTHKARNNDDWRPAPEDWIPALNDWTPNPKEMILPLEIISDTEFRLESESGSPMIFTRQ